MIGPYTYRPITWEIDGIYDDGFGIIKYYKIEDIPEIGGIISRTYTLPKIEENYNIQIWITEEGGKKTSELGIEQNQGEIKTFVYTTDTWHKDIWRHDRYVLLDPLENEQPSINRIKSYKKIIAKETGRLIFQIKNNYLTGFLDEQIFGEIRINEEKIIRRRFGIEVYGEVIPNFKSQRIYTNVWN